MDRDRNLLFGVFAVQLRKVTPSQIMEAAAAWAVDPAKDLADRLLASRAIQARDKALIQRLVDEAIAEYGGDPHATLVAFGGDDQIAESFCGTISLTGSGGVQVTKPAPGAPVLLSDRAPGVQETPGRYTRESEHARGGMGRVLLVHDEHLGRDIALKELLPIPGESTAGFQPAPQPKTPARLSAGLIARFLQEARITGQLEHPAIVPVYELGTRSDNSLYYTMKLVRGGSMAESIRKAATLEDRLKLLPHFVDLCQAIAYAHSRGVIHRDLKPGNVMVGEFGETVVIDWGLAKAKGKKDIHEEGLSRTFEMISKGQSADAVNTAYGYALGTPAYMSPEQAKGQLDQIDERSDVYSLGAILYELLTGRLPFKGDSLADTLKKVITEEPRPIREFTPDAPPELAAIAMRAMAKDSTKRYQRAREVAQDIQRFQSGSLVRAHEYTLRQLVSRFVQRNKPLVVASSIALAVVVAVASFAVWRIAEANRNLVEARDDALDARDAESAERKRAEDTIADLERASYVANIKLAAQHVRMAQPELALARLKDTPPNLRNWEWGYLYKALDRSLFTLESPFNVLAVNYSPNGDRIVAGCGAGVVKVWDALTGKDIHSLRCRDNVHSAEFNNDGSHILTAEHGGYVTVWAAGPGTKVLEFDAGGFLNNATFSPDGARIVTGLREGAVVWDAASGDQLLTLTVTDEFGFGLMARFSPDGLYIVTVVDNMDGTVIIWDATSGAEIVALEVEDSINDVSFHPDGTMIVTAEWDGKARIWDWRGQREMLTIKGHTNDMITAAYNPDGTKIVTGSFDGTIRIWDALGRELLTLPGDPFNPRAAFSPDSKTLVASAGFRTKVWQINSEPELLMIGRSLDYPTTASYSPDGTKIMTASFVHGAKVWDSATRAEVLSIGADLERLVEQGDGNNVVPGVRTGEPRFAEDAAFSPDGTRILARDSGSAVVWDAATGRELMVLEPDEDVSIDFAMFSPDGTKIVAAYDDQAVGLWDSNSGVELLVLRNHRAKVTQAVFSPNSATLATVSEDGAAYVWESESGKLLFEPQAHAGKTKSAAYSPDGSRIITASSDDAARVWDWSSGVETLKLVPHGDGSLESAAFTVDGKLIVTTLMEACEVWDAASGAFKFALKGHSDHILATALSPGNSRIATASRDGTVRVWDLLTGWELLSLTNNPANSSVSVAFSPDGSSLLTTCENAVVLWDAAPWWSGAWHNDRTRGELVKLILRSPPDTSVSSWSEVEGEAANRLIEDLRALSEQWRNYSDRARPGEYREIEGQGVLITEPGNIPSLPSFAFKTGDLLARVAAKPVDSLADAATAVDSFLGQFRDSSAGRAVLDFTILNDLEHRVVAFDISSAPRVE